MTILHSHVLGSVLDLWCKSFIVFKAIFKAHIKIPILLTEKLKRRRIKNVMKVTQKVM